MFDVKSELKKESTNMYCEEYSHLKNYWEFEVVGELPNEGVLKGKEGEFRFKRIPDGIAIYESSLLNSGFVYPGSPDDIFVPRSINGIPVVELHQTVHMKSKYPFSIENGGIKRLFLNIQSRFLVEQIGESDNALSTLLLYMLREQENMNQDEKNVTVNFTFCGNQVQQVEYCSISCDRTVILHVPRTNELSVNAKKVVIRGDIPKCVKKITFSGKVYPFYEQDWDCDIPNNRCFEGMEKLEWIEGSLSGKDGWSFSDCSSLKSVHLSNGIENMPAYAFRNCKSMNDIYIPDTVEQIGKYAFSGCTSLQTVHLPSKLVRISEGMFQECSSLRKVFLSDTIEVIEDNAFAGCINMRKPWIPKNIKYIAQNAFPNPEW